MSDSRQTVLSAARQALQQDPRLSRLGAVKAALRKTFNLGPQDGLWGGSPGAIAMGWRGHEEDDDLFEDIAFELAQSL